MSKPDKAPAPLAGKQRPPKLFDRNFGISTFKFNRWSAELEESQTLEQAFEPTFFGLVADKMMGQDKANPRGVGDIIEIRKRDTALFCEVIVLAIGPGYVRVQPLRAFEPEEPEIPEKSPLVTRWNNSTKKHEIIRAEDKQLMHPGFQVKQDSVNWIAEHLKQMAPAA
jgi:hypothetical protein